MVFDYIIVGAGSAGCVLASRLTEDPACRVLLLEAGEDLETFWIRTPAGLPFLFYDKRFNWCFSSESQPLLGDRRIYWPRGKVVVGSSAIDGMLYMRGDAQDYDDWAAAGNEGWAYRDVLPYFKRLETNLDGANEWRGDRGPVMVSRAGKQHPVTAQFIQAAVNAGISHNEDFNAARQEGVGYCQHTIGHGVRSSSSRAYLASIRNRPNLTIVDRAQSRRILVEEGTAVGVEYERGGKLISARALAEVLVSCGTVGSPQLLLLSGVGHAPELNELGIPVKVDLPGVGKNLQDHFGVNTGFEVRRDMSMNSVFSSWRRYLQGAKYLLTRKGPLAMGPSHAQAFACTNPEVDRPDVQISFRPWSFSFEREGELKVHPFPGIQIAGIPLRPKSRGSVSLRSRDATDSPVIRPNYFGAPEDEQTAIRATRLIRKIVSSAPMRDLVVREDFPGPQVDSESELLNFVRRNSQSIYHPVGTCKMGRDTDAVVDARLRVHGVRHLRVVDASIMPSLIGGNTNAPTIMIAEKAADMIIADRKTRIQT